MQLSLIAVGKLRPAFRDACDDYLRRLGRFVPVQEHEVREAGRATGAADSQELESRRLLEAVPAGARVVLLDLDGSRWSSEQLATELERWRHDARDHALLIGGATGVSASLRTRADLRWSLGPLTLPHELARVVVAEQLYRASTILRGQPYHRGAR
jgi:23S rRNA (pseudouridine1915-N3)-methyltransferase